MLMAVNFLELSLRAQTRRQTPERSSHILSDVV
jgi:hypothetical protein